MIKKLLFIISFLFISFSVLPKNVNELFSSNELHQHYEAMQFFHQQILILDSAEAMDLLHQWAEGTETDRAIIATAWKGIYLHLKNLSTTDSSIQLLSDAYSSLEENNLSEWQPIFANYLGYLLLLDKDYQNGGEYLLLSDHLIKSVGYSHFFEIDRYLYHIARMYFEFGKHEKSIEYLEKVLLYAKEDSKIKQYSLNLMGITNAELKNYEKASYFLELIKKELIDNGDSSGIAALNGNLGILYAFQENYRKAEPLLQQAYQFNHEHQNWKSAATNILWLSEVNMNLDKLDSANFFLDAAAALLNRNKIENIESWGLYYRIASHFYEKTADYRKAFLFLDSTQLIEKKILENRDASLLSDVNIKLISDKHFFEVQLLKNRNEHEAFIRNVTIGLSLLIILFFLYLWFINHRKRNKEKRLHQEEQRKTLAELENFKKRIQLQNSTLESVKEQLKKMKLENAEEEKVMHNLHRELAQSVILTEEDWQRFKSLFEKAHPDFLLKVQNEFPDLSNAEIRLLSLLKLNLSVTEMANMLAILPESVRKTRQRLMKKLEISYHKELRNFIKEI